MLGSAKHYAKIAEDIARKEKAKKERREALIASGVSLPSASSKSRARKGKEHRREPSHGNDDDVSVLTSGTVESSTTQEKKPRRGLFGRNRANSHPAQEPPSHPPVAIVETSTSPARAIVDVETITKPAPKPAPQAAPKPAPVAPTVTNSKPAAAPKPGSIAEKRERATATLRSIRDTIAVQEKRDDELDMQIQATLVEAKQKMKVGNKRSALRCMKKRKLLQMEQEKIGSAIDNLESMSLSIESSINSLQVLDAMRAGSSAMKNLQGKDGVEQTEDVIFDIQDTLDIEREINAILSAPVQTIVEDDDELLRELEGFEGGISQPMDLDMPEAPHTRPAAQTQSVVEDMEAS